MSGYRTKLVVAAIDFGTTFSGYAYSLKNEYEKDPLKIYANQDWTDGSGLITLKAPTVVLFDKDKNFHSFGYDAESKYATLSEEEKHHDWRYFRRFKMKLNERVNIRRNMTLKDDQDNTMFAMDVFAASIKYLKDHLMGRLKDRVKAIQERDLFWVLTVPAIWHDGAKQFMREAAIKGGIPEDQLTLALEPEAAAIYCKELVVSKAKEQGKEAELQSFRPGAQFMVLDLGGGTVDITVHQVERNGTLQELDSPSGGPWGGTMVDKEVDSLLDDLFDTGLMRDFRKECKVDDLDLQRTIELKKRQCKDTEVDKINIKLPNALFEFYKERKGEHFESSLTQSKFVKSVFKKRDRLQINGDIFLNMFAQPKDNLLCHIEGLLSKPQLRNVKTLMMVGGFSESEIMKNAVKSAFPTKNVIVPDQAGLAVVKGNMRILNHAEFQSFLGGRIQAYIVPEVSFIEDTDGAVMFGHNTDSICSRKLPYTYGISTAIPFDEKIHPESKKVFRDGLYKCEDVFKVFIKAGTTVVPHKTCVQETFQAPFTGASKAVVEIYRSNTANPIYVSDEGCYRVGEIDIKLFRSSTTTKQMVDVIMLFGDTQLHVTANEHGTGNKVSAKFNFLR